MKNFTEFPFDEIGKLATKLIEEAYGATQLVPTATPEVAPIPKSGEGIDGLTDALHNIVTGSAGLAAPTMIGHMDTAAHPAAVFADALVAALNNNLLFREISPFASQVEEMMVDQIGQHLGLTATGNEGWKGTFTSGGSLANLTGLFAAVGGFTDVEDRAGCELFVPACAHTSVKKAAAILGIPSSRVSTIQSDDQGRADPNALVDALQQSAAKRKVVVGVLGSTVHGAVEDISVLARIATQYNAWLHVDAVYGGALAFSHEHRHLLAGLDLADSVILGPQKWMYVPRVSAIVWVKGKERFDELLGMGMPYSATGDVNRGNWGLQGSRRADAVTLWATLRYLGTDVLGDEIDRSIALTRRFYDLLMHSKSLKPSHLPDLNLLCFQHNGSANGQSLGQIHRLLGRGDVPWVSLSQWQECKLLRAVLLSPGTTEEHLIELIKFLEEK